MAKMIKLQATKPFRYDTRALVPGDVFEVPSRYVKLLIKRGAKEVRAAADVPPPPPAVAEKIAVAVAPPPIGDDLAGLRAEYEQAIGKRPFMGWDAATLREKIAAARAV